MASYKGTATVTDLLNLFFNKTLASWAGVLASTGDVNITLALHTADPTAGGTQTSSECAYTGYARVNVLRTAAGWTIATTTAKNTALIQFNEADSGYGGTETVRYVSLGINSGQIMYAGQLTAPRTVSAGIQPQFAHDAITVTES